MPMVYCQLFSGEKLLTDRLFVSIEREARPNERAVRGGTFRVPEDQLKTIRADQAMRLEFPEKLARRLKITNGNSLPIIAHQVYDRIAHFGRGVRVRRIVCGCASEQASGNGSIMRLVPVSIRRANLPACLLRALHLDEDVASCSDSEHEPAKPPVRNTSLVVSIRNRPSGIRVVAASLGVPEDAVEGVLVRFVRFIQRQLERDLGPVPLPRIGDREQDRIQPVQGDVVFHGLIGPRSGGSIKQVVIGVAVASNWFMAAGRVSTRSCGPCSSGCSSCCRRRGGGYRG